MSPDAASGPRGIARMLEDSLTAPFHPGAVFDALSPAPAPAYARMALVVGLFTGAFLAINLAHAWLAYPAVVGYGPFWLAFGAVWLLLAGVFFSFLAAGVLHIVSRLLGGAGPFPRSYQIVAVSSSLAAYQSILNWFPSFWPLPFLGAAVIAGVGLQKLHQTPGRPTWACVALLCALALSGVEAALHLIRRPAVEAAVELGEAARMVQRLPQAYPNPALMPGSPATGPLPEMPAIPLGDLPAPRAFPADGPDNGEPRQAPEPEQPPAARPQNQQLPAVMAGPLLMLDQMLNNPAAMKGLPPEKAKQLRELGGLLKELQASMKSGKPLTDQQRARMLRVMAEFNAELTQSMPQTPAPPPGKRGAKH